MSSRREFLKTKFLGSLLVASGMPLVVESNPLFSALAADPAPRNPWDEIRAKFPLDAERKYFNIASLGPSPQPVIDRVCTDMQKLNAIANHGHAHLVEPHQKLADLLGATPDEIAITRNTTEGINIAARSLPLKAGDEVILTTHEHVGGAAPWLALQKEMGIVIKLVELDLTGADNLKPFVQAMTDKTKVVAFSHVLCTTGMVLPARAIVETCRQRGIYTVIDGAQAVGMMPVNVTEINADFYAGGGHKWLFGPKGTGMLYINAQRLDEFKPTFVGAYSTSEYDLATLTMEYRSSAQREEYGTRNTPLALGLASAVDFLNEIEQDKIVLRSRYFVKKFREAVFEMPELEMLTPASELWSGAILTFRFKNRDNKAIVTRLRNEKRLILRHIYENNLDAIRISFSVVNTEEEVDFLIEQVRAVVEG